MDIDTLIERAKDGDSHALETLYRMYHPRMLGLCINITHADEDTAKDLVHDAFVLAFTSLHTLNTPASFGDWLKTIVRNVSLKYMERKKKISFVPIIDEDKKIADGVASAESTVNWQDILDMVDKLPDGYGRVFRLYVIDGFSHQEIAAILGIEAHSSSSQLSRAKAMLRRMIGYRMLAIVLLMLTSISMYFFLSNKEKPLPPPYPKMAEDDRRMKNANINESPRTPENTSNISKPLHEKAVLSNAHRVQTDTTTIVSTAVPDVQIAEQKHDSSVDADSILLQPVFPDYGLVAKNALKKAPKLQILVTGSLGPVLAQNIDRRIAIGKPDLDAEAPVLPENVDTWEDYSRYLHMTGHDDTTRDSMALMNIADHNHGTIKEQEHHDHPITFGISMSCSLSHRWSIEAGLQYSLLKSGSTMGNQEYHIGKRQRLHYIGIPLRLSCRLMDYRNLSVYASAGLTLNIPVHGSVDSTYIVAGIPAYTDNQRITPPVQWSTGLSLGIQYKFLPHWTLYVEPTLNWHIPNGSDTHTIWTEHPLMFSAPFGIRFTW